MHPLAFYAALSRSVSVCVYVGMDGKYLRPRRNYLWRRRFSDVDSVLSDDKRYGTCRPQSIESGETRPISSRASSQDKRATWHDLRQAARVETPSNKYTTYATVTLRYAAQQLVLVTGSTISSKANRTARCVPCAALQYPAWMRAGRGWSGGVTSKRRGEQNATDWDHRSRAPGGKMSQ